MEVFGHSLPQMAGPPEEGGTRPAGGGTKPGHNASKPFCSLLVNWFLTGLLQMAGPPEEGGTRPAGGGTKPGDLFDAEDLKALQVTTDTPGLRICRR